ncbi:hypothetical protein SteCoe_28126 [Stentor coeruleus]|uniref:AAA-ATPase-like domain-containing protein n=1 Tax=Stentor coeruleus TaxID=5963 RepID=A0A1R2B918_9CILI|nr:hypothetical protein SteCoe_28126 [Stentor coeruleus]
MHCLNALNQNMDDPYSYYWIDSGSTKIIEDAIMEIPEIKKIEDLMMNGQVEFKYNNAFTFSSIKTNEEDLLSLLLNAGYITNFENSIYKIPNQEVNFYIFKNLFPIWLKKRYPESNIKLLLTNFENIPQYGKAFQNEFLDKKGYENHSESYFKILVASPFVTLPKNDAYKLYSEQTTDAKTRIDVLLSPINGKSNSVFILELKKTESSEKIEKIINDAFVQVFSRKYADYVLERAEEQENSHWKNFCIRVLVFSPNQLKNKWTITIKELIFDKEGLQKACETYEQNKGMEDSLIELLTPIASSISEYPCKSENSSSFKNT